jgi:hypothetical protein
VRHFDPQIVLQSPIFNEKVLDLLEAVPELRGDPDLGATNEGVTIVWLK